MLITIKEKELLIRKSSLTKTEAKFLNDYLPYSVLEVTENEHRYNIKGNQTALYRVLLYIAQNHDIELI